MFIGQTRFVTTSMTLETACGEVRLLTTAQAAVLTLLMADCGRVVSRASLREAIKQATSEPHCLESTINSLGKLVGQDWHTCFEVVDKQGFILHSSHRPVRRLFGGPQGELSLSFFFAFVCVLLASLCWLSGHLLDNEELPFSEDVVIHNANGEALLWRRVGPSSESRQQLKSLIAQCQSQSWQRISVLASTFSPSPLLHLVFDGGSLDFPQNLKLFSSENSEPLSISTLKEAGICD